jgi:hypothetical protein
MVNFRNGFYAGLVVALIVGVGLARLWRAQRQVELHSTHLLAQIEKGNWNKVGEFVAIDYHDRWGNDRPLLLERLREIFRALPNARIEATGPNVHADSASGRWTAKIRINGTGEFADLIEARVNSLDVPFEFEWRQGATWPWDWKLVSVSNPALEISSL